MAKWFALMDIRQMDLDRRQPDGGNGIAYGDAGVGIGGWIDDHAVVSAPGFLNPTDQLAFAVRLPDIDFHRQFLRQLGQGRVDPVQRLGTIDGLLPGAEEVQIGPV